MHFRIRQGTEAANIAMAYLKDQGIQVSQDQALELAARLHGYADLEAMEAETSLFSIPLAMRPDSSTEFTMLTEVQRAVWVTVKNVRLEIRHLADGVTVDAYPDSIDAQDYLSSLSASFDEAAKVLKQIEDDGPVPDTNPFA